MTDRYIEPWIMIFMPLQIRSGGRSLSPKSHPSVLILRTGCGKLLVGVALNIS